MFDMFAYCYKVVTINLPNFRITESKKNQGMFYKNYKLKYINLQNFEVNSSSITTISLAFSDCSSIVFINLNSF